MAKRLAPRKRAQHRVVQRCHATLRLGPGHPFVWGCAEVCPLQAAYAVGVAFRSGHFLAGHQGYAVAEAHRLQVGEMAHCVVVSHGQEIEAACPGLGAQLSQAQCPVGVFAAPTAADSNSAGSGSCAGPGAPIGPSTRPWLPLPLRAGPGQSGAKADVLLTSAGSSSGTVLR